MPRKDLFEEFPDKKFADLTGRKHDVNRAVRPTVCELLPTRLCQILWHDLRPVLPDRIMQKRSQLKDRFCRKGRYDCLVDLVNVIEQLDYCPQVLLSRKESSLAYRLLVDTIGELGPLPDIGEGHCPRRHAIDACGAFARVLGPDCWTAYFRDRRLNRASFLSEKGLDFPEAMSGFVWKNDLPTRILFNDVPDKVRRALNLWDDSPVQLYPPSILTELLTEGGHMTGTFRCRERIDPDRVIGVRLLWDNSTLVLFLGWRVEGASKLEAPENGVPEDPKQKRNAGDFWEEVTQLARAGAEKGKFLRSLELATRYFNVWLAAGSSGLAEEEGLDEGAMDRTSRLNHAEIIQRVAAAAALSDEESRANELRLAVHTAVSEAHHYHVHWVVKKEGSRKKKGSRRVLRIQNARLKSCGDGYIEEHDVGSANSSGGKSSGRPGPTTYELPIEPEDPNNQQRFAKRSVCVQSLLWRVGLLIDHSRNKEFWTRRRLSRVEFPNQVGELAVPILDETGEAEGVISVESHKPPLS